MTVCAGICRYRKRTNECSIGLSEPLLKFRSRKELLETLLHEMIHAFLFVTHSFDNRSDHGPKFVAIMKRINSQTNLNITVYHSFHNEVAYYQQHWWQCNGVCKHRAPYFGIVKRSRNRRPAPTDFWWAEHARTCGGQFEKIREPENFSKKTNQMKDDALPVSKPVISPDPEPKVAPTTDLMKIREFWNKKYPIAKKEIKLTECKFCSEFVVESNTNEHRLTCIRRSEQLIECIFCGTFVDDSQFSAHFETCQKMNAADQLLDQTQDLFEFTENDLFDKYPDFDLDDTIVL